MILCDKSVSTSLPAPLDYFTTYEVGGPATPASDSIALFFLLPQPLVVVPVPQPFLAGTRLTPRRMRGQCIILVKSWLSISMVQAATLCRTLAQLSIPLLTSISLPPQTGLFPHQSYQYQKISQYISSPSLPLKHPNLLRRGAPSIALTMAASPCRTTAVSPTTLLPSPCTTSRPSTTQEFSGGQAGIPQGHRGPRTSQVEGN